MKVRRRVTFGEFCLREGVRELSGLPERFCILIWVVIMPVYTQVKIH